MVRARSWQAVWALATFVALGMGGTALRAGDEAGPVVVEVVGRAGRALEGAGVFRRDGGRWSHVGVTGPGGTLELAAAARAGRWELAASGDPGGTNQAGRFVAPDLAGQRTRVGGSRVRLTIDCGADVRIDVVDAETGAPLAGARWRPADGYRLNEPTPWFSAGEPVFLLVGAEGRRYSGIEIEGLDAHRQTHAVQPAELAPAAKRGWQAFWLQRASALVGVIPVRRAVEVTVQVQGKDGKPTPAGSFHGRFPGGDRLESVQPSQPTPVQGLRAPYYRGARVEVTAYAGDERGSAELALPWTLPRTTFYVPVRLAAYDLEDGWMGEGPGALRGWGGGTRPPDDPAGARLEIRVLRWERSALVDAEISLEDVGSPREAGHPPAVIREGRSDSKGALAFEGLSPGTYRVDVHHPLAIRMRATVVVKPREKVARVELVEPQGVTLAVHVVAGASVSLPFAGVEVRGPLGGAPDRGADTARLDPFTDATGRRTFRRVEPGEIVVEAWYGPFAGSTSVTAADGAHVPVELVLTQPR